MDYIDYGLGVFERSVFEDIPEGHPCDLAQIYQQRLGKGKLVAFEVKQRSYEIGSIRGLEETADYLRNPDSSSQA